MGVALAQFLSSDLFMGQLEEQIANKSWFPRIWLRYVDDIFGIVKKDEVDNIEAHLNDIYASVKFTYQVEEENGLPFLDVNVSRNGTQLEFDIYRKTTNSDRFITPFI